MKFLKIILGIAVVLVAIFFVVGQFLPRAYLVKRSVVIQAERDRIHALVGNLNAWREWSPWMEDDPTLKTTIGRKATGVGAHQSWTSKRGPGELTFTESSSTSGIAYDMSFDKGRFRSQGSVEYTDASPGTRVTWTMTGDDGGSLFGRYFAVMTDSMVGPKFERGLEKLKAAAEKR